MEVYNVRGKRRQAVVARERLRLLTHLENSSIRSIERALNTQYNTVAQFIEDNETNIIDRPLQATQGLMAAPLKNLYRRTGAVFGDAVVEQFERTGKSQQLLIEMKGAMKQAYQAAFNDWSKEHALSAVTGLGRVTKRLLTKTVTKGLADGKSWGNIARDIEGSRKVNKMRARRIARTEGHTAANKANDTAVRAAHLKHVDKQWSATKDERTRISHSIADGKKVYIDEPFIVAGESLMYPGDPNGSPGNIVNCRCVLFYHPSLKKRRR
jgi:hypothetical protein